MTDDEINAVVSELLHKRFDDIGFERSTVKSDLDFDGDSILRITAHFNNKELPSGWLVDTLHDIRSELRHRGDGRIVILHSAVPDDELADEEVEE
jgi:hypothetical protein